MHFGRYSKSAIGRFGVLPPVSKLSLFPAGPQNTSLFMWFFKNSLSNTEGSLSESRLLSWQRVVSPTNEETEGGELKRESERDGVMCQEEAEREGGGGEGEWTER